MQFYSTSSINAHNGIKALVYGQSGMGKTRLLASAPNPVILSAEKGLLSLRQFNIPFAEIRSLMELQQARQWLTTSREAQQFWTVCLDSLSDIAETCLTFERQRAGKDPRRAYGELADQIGAEMKAFRDIPRKHVVLIAKQGVTVNEANQRFNGPLFPGKMLEQAAPYIFDGVFQQFRYVDPATKQVGYFLRCHPDNQNIAKDRSGNLSEYENADPKTGGGLSVLFNKMLGA